MSDEMVVLGDRRHEDNMAGQFDLKIDQELMIIHTGAGGFHELVFLREGVARDLYEQLSRVFDKDRSSNSDEGDSSE